MTPITMKRISILWIFLFLAMEVFGQAWINTNIPGTMGPIPGATPVALSSNASRHYIPGIVQYLNQVYLHDDWTNSLSRRLLAAESNAAQIANFPTNAICLGGSYNSNSFGFYPAAYIVPGSTNILTSSTTTNAEYVLRSISFSATAGYYLNPSIYAQAPNSTGIYFSVSSAGSGATVSSNMLLFNAETQAVVTGAMPGYTDSTTLARVASATVYQTQVVSAVAGTARALADAQIRTGTALGLGKSMMTGWAWSTNGWTAALTNFPTCLAISNSVNPNYYRATAITREHVAFSKHFQPSIGSALLFVDATNGQHTATLLSITNVSGDCSVGRLSVALPAQIVPAKFLPSNWTNYLRDTTQFPVMYFDAERKALVAELATNAISGPGYLYINQPVMAPFSDYYELPVGGDSGNPVLAVFGPSNAVILTALHTAVYGPNYTAIKAQIAAKILALGGTYTTLTDVDFNALGAAVLP